MKIAIVGAGLVGTTSAYYLSKKGHEVTVYDREVAPAMKCSRANGGQLSVCNAETWNTWKNVKRGLKWMFSKDAPLLIRPTPSIPKLVWLAGFLRHTMNGTQERNTILTIRLAQEADYLYKRIISEEGLYFDQSRRGILHVYSNQQSLEDAYASKELFQSNGVAWDYMSPEEIISYDPNMKDFKGLKGGFLTPTDWTGDAHIFCSKLSSVCENMGTKFMFEKNVIGVSGKKVMYLGDGEEKITDNYDAVVLCNGHEIAKWSILHGDFLNIYPVKGYSVTIPDARSGGPSVSLLDDDKKIVCSLLGNRLRIAGTAELDGNNLDIRQDRIKPLLNWARENFPDVDTSQYSAWACLRPMSSDMLPMIRKSKSDGLWYHGGHGHLGWTLASATSYRLSNLM
jgi:D-amino-acid dehydrogenase